MRCTFSTDGEQLRAERVAGLVVGDHPLLVVGDHAARLHAGHDPLERGLEVRGHQLVAVLAAGEDRGLVADVGEVGAGQAARLARDDLQVHVRGERLAACVCTSRISRRPLRSGGVTKIWRSKRPGRSSAGSSFSSRFEAAITTTLSRAAEAVELHEQLVERLVLLARDVVAARGAHGVELVDEDDRRARPCAPGGTAAGCARRRGRRTSRRTRRPTGRRTWRSTRSPPPWRAASCRCRAGRAAGCPSAPWRRACLKRFGSRMNSTTSRSSSFASSTPATSSQRTELDDDGLDLLRLRARHVPDHPDDGDRDQAHEDDRQPGEREALHVAPERARRRRPGAARRARTRAGPRRCRRSRESTLEEASTSPALGQLGARRAAARRGRASLASPQLSCDGVQHRELVGPRSRHQLAELLVARRSRTGPCRTPSRRPRRRTRSRARPARSGRPARAGCGGLPSFSTPIGHPWHLHES